MACQKHEEIARTRGEVCTACRLEDGLTVATNMLLIQGQRISNLKDSLQLIADGPPGTARELARTALARDIA